MRIKGAPKRLACGEFDGEQQRVLAAGCENDLIAIYQRALAGVPFGNRCSEFADEADAPLEFPVRGIHAQHVSFAVEGDDHFVGDHGNGSGHAVVALDRERFGVAPVFPAFGM